VQPRGNLSVTSRRVPLPPYTPGAQRFVAKVALYPRPSTLGLDTASSKTCFGSPIELSHMPNRSVQLPTLGSKQRQVADNFNLPVACRVSLIAASSHSGSGRLIAAVMSVCRLNEHFKKEKRPREAH